MPVSVTNSICSSSTRKSASLDANSVMSLVLPAEELANHCLCPRTCGPVAQTVTQQVHPDHQHHDHQTGECDDPPRRGDVVLAVGDDAAPGREGTLRTGAEVAERGFQQYCL